MKRLLIVGALLLCARPALAQQRPLVTEDPETVGAGRVLLEMGLDRYWSAQYPASGLEGDVWRIPVVGLSFGIGSIVELQVDGGAQHLSILQYSPGPLSDRMQIEGDSTSGFEDMVVATKIKVHGEDATAPGIGIRLATKLPTSSVENGLGLDTMDFYGSLLVGKTVGSVRWVGNVGLGILSNPVETASQNDVLTYGFSVAGALTNAAEVVGEINGRLSTRSDPPVGTGTRSMLRAGLRYTIGAGRIDGGFLVGLTDPDPSFGFTAGYTYVFNAYKVP